MSEDKNCTCDRCKDTNGLRMLAVVNNGDINNMQNIAPIIVPCSHESIEERKSKYINSSTAKEPVSILAKSFLKLVTVDGATVNDEWVPTENTTINFYDPNNEKTFADAPVPLSKPKNKTGFKVIDGDKE